MFDQRQPAAVRQGQIQRDQVGAPVADRLDRIVGAAALGYHVEIRLHLDQPLEALANDGMVIDQNNAVHPTTLHRDPAVMHIRLADGVANHRCTAHM